MKFIINGNSVLNMAIKLACACLILACGLNAQAQQTIIVPVGQQQGMVTNLPKQGMTASAVVEKYGKPMRVAGPYGQPPITRWYFEGFSVYFESGFVLHSVSTFIKKNTMPKVIKEESIR